MTRSTERYREQWREAGPSDRRAIKQLVLEDVDAVASVATEPLELIKQIACICDPDALIDTQKMVRHGLAALSALEERVIRLRLGLDNVGEHRLGQIAEEFGVGRERVRQMENKAIGKIKRRWKYSRRVDPRLLAERGETSPEARPDRARKDRVNARRHEREIERRKDRDAFEAEHRARHRRSINGSGDVEHQAQIERNGLSHRILHPCEYVFFSDAGGAEQKIKAQAGSGAVKPTIATAAQARADVNFIEPSNKAAPTSTFLKIATWVTAKIERSRQSWSAQFGRRGR